MRIYRETNIFLEQCFHVLESPAPSPVPTDLGGHIVLRYDVKSLDIAIIQKLARYISGLNASLILLEKGFTQELGALFRTLDEFHEDICFLALPKVSEMELTETHVKYLDDFFQEEFDVPNNAILSTQKRKTIPRKKIHAIIANFGNGGLNPHDGKELLRTISQTYSGYIHGASCHICEMIEGGSFKYYLSGMPGTYRQSEFEYNYWDYAYRGLITTVMAAKALGDGNIVDRCYKFIDHFEDVTGDTGSGDAEKMMNKVKRKKPNKSINSD